MTKLERKALKDAAERQRVCAVEMRKRADEEACEGLKSTLIRRALRHLDFATGIDIAFEVLERIRERRG